MQRGKKKLGWGVGGLNGVGPGKREVAGELQE